MTITLKPVGRGNWSTTTMTLQHGHMLPLLVRAGQTIVVAGVTFRICEVKP